MGLILISLEPSAATTMPRKNFKPEALQRPGSTLMPKTTYEGNGHIEKNVKTVNVSTIKSYE